MVDKEARQNDSMTGRKLSISLGKGVISFVNMGLCGLLLIGMYHGALVKMIGSWNRDEYTYCYLMPFVVVYLIWQKRASLANLPSLPSWKGMIPLFVGIAFFWLGELGGEYFTLYLSLWLVLVGLCWIHLGWKKIRTIAFPLFMIVTMFPLPSFIYGKISLKLQLISSWLGVSMLHAYDMPAFREGNIIDLAFTQLQVMEACSGLRTLISLMVLGLLMVYFFRDALWKRVLLMISVVPIAILSNSMRIALTGILYEIWGAGVAEGFFHGFSGILIFVFSFCLLLLEIWILKWVPPREAKIDIWRERREKRERRGAWGSSEVGYALHGAGMEPRLNKLEIQARQDLPDLRTRRGKQSTKRIQALFQPQFIVAVVILGLTLVLSQQIEFREKIPMSKSFDRFPVNLGGWRGTRLTMEQELIDKLDLSDYIILNYENKLGKEVNFYVAYYESQRKGESIHSPGSCLPGGGWIFSKAGSMTVSLTGPGGGSIRVNRAFMRKEGQERVAYYWFPARGRILTNLYQLKIFTFWDALTKQRTDGALVRIITPVYDSENVADADARLQGFTQEIVPILSEFLPN